MDAAAEQSIGFFQALRHRQRIIHTLVLREIKIQLRTSKLGYLIVLAEPAAQFAIMFTIFSFVGHQPSYGTSLGLFLATGLIPFVMFMHLAQRTMRAVRIAKTVARIPNVNVIDNAIARAFLEYLTLVFITLVVFTTLVFIGLAPIPAHPSVLISAMLAIGLAGFGTGLVNGVLTHLSRAYAMVWSVASRSMLFISGVFYTPSSLPPTARDIVLWNPILHGLEWFRAGIFDSYPTGSLSRTYLVLFGVSTLTLGLMLLRVFSGKLMR